MAFLADNHPALDHPTAVHRTRPPRHEGGGAPALHDLEPGRYLVCGDEAFALTSDVVHVGRGMAADLRLDDHTVSSRHAIVVHRGGRLRILDDRSTNGTIVNGRRVEQVELNDGDVVVLGRVVLSYRVVR